MYGDVICYGSLECNYGALCLDCREIRDGIQQCMHGYDEDDCDIAELNQCDDDEYFLDGHYDGLHWSDEIRKKVIENVLMKVLLFNAIFVFVHQINDHVVMDNVFMIDLNF